MVEDEGGVAMAAGVAAGADWIDASHIRVEKTAQR